MSANTTSRVFAAAREMKRRLHGAGFPPHPVTGTRPQIAFAVPDPASHFEIVQVVPDLGEDGGINFRASPNGRDERFAINVLIDVLDGLDEDNMLDRLEELADVVQRTLFDDSDGVASNARAIPLDVGGTEVKLSGMSQVSFSIVQSSPEELHGVATVRYEHVSRI